MKPRDRRYVNARFVLPRDLYIQVLEYLEGKLAWFPIEDPVDRDSRNNYVRLLRDEGLSNKQIAKKLCLSVRHVRRILNESATSLPAGDDKGEKQ